MGDRGIQVGMWSAVAAVAGGMLFPPTANAGYPQGGTFACDRVEHAGAKQLNGFGCLASPGFPTQGPVDKFYVQLKQDPDSRWFCVAGIATIGISAAPGDLVADGCVAQ
ncbi:hypothetical protein [Nocardia sp. NPDC020380]|uniref:hypothetical protein n=1 Tax=Nocardia sp. NPDC020380 TaxID=3364309 RepID=UPI00379074DA